MDLLYFDPHRNEALEAYVADYGAFLEHHAQAPVRCRRAESIEEVLREADVVSLHTVLSDETVHLIDAPRLALMKPTAILINASRGPIVDEAALVEHCRANPGFHAGLDVFEHEPELAPGLAELPNVVTVPHIGSATSWTREGMATLAASNVAACLQGWPVWGRDDVTPFLGSAPPQAAPSIVNAAELGLPHVRPAILRGDDMSEITTGAEDDMTQMTMKLADRVARLGTETAFAVSAEAAAFAAKGNKVYPFHLGDMNLPTPENVVEAAERAMRDGKTGYCPNGGIPQLREALAAEVSTHARHRLLRPRTSPSSPAASRSSASSSSTLMNPGDEVLYPNPGFPIYESQIEFHGGVAKPYGFVPGEKNFLLDFEAIEAAITPRTRLLIFNDLHNPTGAESPPRGARGAGRAGLKHDLYVLSDEAYWDIRYSGTSRSIASLPGMAERTVILYTFCKKFAMTGWRLGGADRARRRSSRSSPRSTSTRSRCTNHFVQYAGVEALTGDQSRRRRRSCASCRSGATSPCARSTPSTGVTCYSPDGHLLPLPRRDGGHGAQGLDRLRRLPPGRARRRPAVRSARGCTSAASCRASTDATSASPTRASTPTGSRRASAG